MRNLAKYGVIIGALIMFLSTNIYAASICYGPYSLPDGRLVNTCGETSHTIPLGSGAFFRTWSVPQNSPNGNVDKLVAR